MPAARGAIRYELLYLMRYGDLRVPFTFIGRLLTPFERYRCVRERDERED